MEYGIEEGYLPYHFFAYEIFYGYWNHSLILYLIEEVPNFKTFTSDSIGDGKEAIMRHIKAH